MLCEAGISEDNNQITLQLNSGVKKNLKQQKELVQCLLNAKLLTSQSMRKQDIF